MDLRSTARPPPRGRLFGKAVLCCAAAAVLVTIAAVTLWFCSFHALSICNNTAARMMTHEVFGWKYWRTVSDTDVSRWVKANAPSSGNDWFFCSGSGGGVMCALGHQPPRFRYFVLLDEFRADPDAVARLRELVAGPREPRDDVTRALVAEYGSRGSVRTP